MWCLHFSELTIVSLCMSVRVCWCTCGHVCGDQRPTAGAILQVPSPLSSETGFLRGQELQLASEARESSLPISASQCWDYIHIFLLFLALFTWVLKIKFRVLCLQVKYFTNRDISQPVCYFLNCILYYLKSTIIRHTWHDAVNRISIHSLKSIFGGEWFRWPFRSHWKYCAGSCWLRRTQESRAAEARVMTQRKQYLMRWAVRNGSPQL